MGLERLDRDGDGRLSAGELPTDGRLDLSQADRLLLDIRGVKLTVEASADGLKLGRMTIPGTRKLSLRLIVDNTSLDVYFGEHGTVESWAKYRSTCKAYRDNGYVLPDEQPDRPCDMPRSSESWPGAFPCP